MKRIRNKNRLAKLASFNQSHWRLIGPRRPRTKTKIVTLFNQEDVDRLFGPSNGSEEYFANNSASADCAWNDLTAEQILHDFNAMIATVWGTRNRGTRERYKPSIQIVDGHPQNIYGKTLPTMLRHLYEPAPFHRDRAMVYPSGWIGDPVKTEVSSTFNPAVNQQEKEPQQ